MVNEPENKKSFFSRFSTQSFEEPIKAALDELEGMEMSDEKLERYKAAKALIKRSVGPMMIVFLWRALVFLLALAVFLVVISFVNNTAVEIATFVVLVIISIFMISPIFPSPLQAHQQRLTKMMKNDGIKNKDC